MSVSSFNLSQSFNYTPFLFYKRRFKSEINSFCIRTPDYPFCLQRGQGMQRGKTFQHGRAAQRAFMAETKKKTEKQKKFSYCNKNSSNNRNIAR
jgi:hypothetical protein